MNKKTIHNRRLERNRLLRNLVTKSKKTCTSFFNSEYIYCKQEAVEETGLDEEQIQELVEEYVIQMINAVDQFEEFIYTLQNNADAKKELDYTPLRDLAHKNLGVARNLRIKNAEKILNEMMVIEDLQELYIRVETLRACAVLLKPDFAFNTLKELDF